MNNKIHLLFIIVIVILVAFYISPQEYVYETFGISYINNSTEVAKKVKIEFDGIYQKRVFKNDTFYGDVYINDVAISDYNLNFDNKNRAQLINYNDESKENKVVGMVYKNYKFSEFVIYLNKQEEGLIIVGPSNNLNEAEQIVNTLLNSK